MAYLRTMNVGSDLVTITMSRRMYHFKNSQGAPSRSSKQACSQLCFESNGHYQYRWRANLSVKELFAFRLTLNPLSPEPAFCDECHTLQCH